MSDDEIKVFETWEKGKKPSRWVDTCGGCGGNSQRLMEGWVLWITADDGTEVYTRLCQSCRSYSARHGITHEFVSQDSKFEP